MISSGEKVYVHIDAGHESTKIRGTLTDAYHGDVNEQVWMVVNLRGNRNVVIPAHRILFVEEIS